MSYIVLWYCNRKLLNVAINGSCIAYELCCLLYAWKFCTSWLVVDNLWWERVRLLKFELLLADVDVEDPTYEQLYISVCHRLGVAPTSYFTKRIKENDISLKHHGVNSTETRAISEALKVGIKASTQLNFPVYRQILSDVWW